MADEDATQEEVDGVLETLEAAIDGLKEEEELKVKVESVSAIDGIEVAFGEVEELVLPAEVTVTLNDEDATEEVLAVVWDVNEDYDVNVAGEYTFTGTIEVAEDAEYTISEELAAVEVSVTVLEPTEAQVTAAVAAVRAATNGPTMLTALQNPVLVQEGLVDVNEDLATEYYTKINANVALVTSVARVQQYVNLVNTEAADELQGLIDAVNEAVADLDLIALGTALNDVDLDLDNVLAGNVFDAAYLNALAEATTETKKQIQDVINATNLEEVEALVAEAEEELTPAALAEVTAPMLALFEEEVAEAFQDRLDAVQETINVNAAIAQVNAATTADELKTALELAALDLDNLDMAGNKAAYFTAFDALTIPGADEFETVAAIQAFVDEVNLAEETGAVTAAIAQVNAATDADELKTALELAALDLDNLDMAGNKAAYFTAFDALTIPGADEFETVAEIQAFVDAVNLEEAIAAVQAEVKASVTAANLLAALQDSVLDLDNVVARNTEVYALELEAIFDADNAFEFETVADIQAFVNDANATPVGLVNTAKNTTEMRAALENADLELDLAVYNELTSLQKNLVAQKLRADGTEFTDADSVQTELDAAVLGLL